MNLGLSAYKYPGTVFFGKSSQSGEVTKKQMPRCCCSCHECQELDIQSSSVYPLNVLSNFTRSYFKVDGVMVSSMEGFLQSLKTPNVEEQKEVCGLIGFTAKKIGSQIGQKRGFDGRTLYWQGKAIERCSKEYQELLKKAFLAKYESDYEFRDALACTKGRKLVHSIGKQDPKETILTGEEFVSILTALRDRELEAHDCRCRDYYWTHPNYHHHTKSCKCPP